MMNDAIDFIKKNDNFLITTHISADGDAYASGLALVWLLEKLKKKCKFILADQKLNQRYSFLNGFEKIQTYGNFCGYFQNVIILDTPTLERCGQVASLFDLGAKTLVIDHHETFEKFGFNNFITTKTSSTAELVSDLIEKLGLDFTEIAETIYTGIVFDTGNFRFSNTFPSTLLRASQMLELGVNPEKIATLLFYTCSEAGIKSMGKILASLQTALDGKIIYSVIDNETYRFLPEDFVCGSLDYLNSIQNAKASMLIAEILPENFRISLRTNTKIDLNKIANIFGGGGHKKASCCTLKGDFNSVLEKITRQIQIELGKNIS
ncbi:bifunctional oligoribonuclease/PAP phosphatase NrnA [bacterium]|nr:bifunctional oligoribonuclease/PAP phosphatase NrnA [bacterium]